MSISPRSSAWRIASCSSGVMGAEGATGGLGGLGGVGGTGVRMLSENRRDGRAMTSPDIELNSMLAAPSPIT